MLALSVYGCRHFIITELFLFFYHPVTWRKTQRRCGFSDRYFFVECSSICNCQVKWIRFACMVEDGKVCDASFFLEKAIPLRLPWKILLLFSKWADRVLLCFPVAGSAVGAQLLCIPLPYLPSASKQWELIFSCCFECWLFSADKRQPWLLDLAFILSRGTC